MHARIAYAFPIEEGQEDDVRRTAADIRAVFSEYGESRRALGLTALGVWLQTTDRGPLVIVLVEGDLESYFEAIAADKGIDEYFRDKIRQWTGSDEEMEKVYRFPQSEALVWWNALET